MTFTYDSFLRPSSTNDKNIIIQDPNGKVIHTINPYSVINTFVSNNLLKVSLSSDRVITLNFVQADLAKQALNILQQRITSLKVDTPQFIDKQVENYVEDYVDTKISENNVFQITNLTNGSGLLNYVPRWISATALSLTSSIYDTGSNVTIGKTSSSNTSILNIRGNRDTFTGPLFDPKIDSYFKQPWLAGGYGLTSSALFVQGVIDGLGSTFSTFTNSFGNLGGWVSSSGDVKPLVRFSATGWGTTLLVENTSPVSAGVISYQGQQTIPTYFKGPDPLFYWEDTQNQRQLILERTSLQWEWRVAVGSPQTAQYRHMTFQRNGFTHEFIISATVNAGSVFLPTAFAEGTVIPAVGQQIFSGKNVVLNPLTDQVTPSNQVTFDNLSNRNEVVPGMILSSPGNNEINRRFVPSQNKWVNLFPVSTVLVQSVVGNTVILSATPSFALKTTDKLSFSGQIASGSVGVNRTRILLNNGNPTEYPEGGPAPIGTIFCLKISKPIVRTLYPGDTFVVAYSAGNVGIGAGASPNYKLLVSGGAIFDNNILLQGSKLTTPFFKMTYGVPLQSNFNLMVGDQFGDSRWVPAGQVVGSGFTGTSSTQLTIGTAGTYFKIKTQPFLSFTPGQVVVLYDDLDALYPDAEYQQGFNKNRIIAEIDSYSFSGGTMSLVVLSARNVGSVSNTWNINLTGAVGPQGPAGFNQGTFSVSGGIIPDKDISYDLGSPTARWNNIYVRDAMVASQSLYLGDVKLSINADGKVNAGNRAINSYNGTSNTPYTIGVVGQLVTLFTNKNLSYLIGESVKVQNRIKSSFEEDGYSEESEHGFFKGMVDAYNPNTGEMDIVITYTVNTGFYSPTWLLDIDTDNLGFESTISTDVTAVKLSGTSTTFLTIPQVGHYVELITQTQLGFKAGQEIIVYNQLPNNYEDEDYLDDGNAYFIGRIDYYNIDTGKLLVICDYSVGNQSYSDWTLTISSVKNTTDINPITQNIYLYGDGHDLIAENFENISITSSIFDVTSQIISLDSDQNIQLLANQDINIFAGGRLNLVGHLNFQSVSQKVQDNVTITSSIVDYDFYSGQIWNHDILSSDYTANFINLPTYNNTSIQARIVINQGPTAYMPTSLSIDGNNQTVYWKDGLSAGATNSIDIIEFEFLRTGGTWSKVFARIDNYV